MLSFITSHLDTILELAVLVAGLAVVVTKLTPSLTDDQWTLKVKEFIEEAVNKKNP